MQDSIQLFDVNCEQSSQFFAATQVVMYLLKYESCVCVYGDSETR